MKIEELSTHQIILLNLLVTFVATIATSIITFSLLSEAPVEVTQTINRVVEKTVERVVPVISTTTVASSRTEKTITTIVVNEEDRVIDAIAKNKASLVRIVGSVTDKSDILALGFLLSSDGVVVTRTRNSLNINHFALSGDSLLYKVDRVVSDPTSGLTFLKIQNTPQLGNGMVGNPTTFAPFVRGSSSDVRIGQTLVSIGGKDQNFIATGRIVSLKKRADISDPKNSLESISSDIMVSKTAEGSIVSNLSGEVIGFENVEAGEIHRVFIPLASIIQTYENVKGGLAK